MEAKGSITGWTVLLLALQFALQGFLALIPRIFMNPYDESVQTFDSLLQAPVISLITLMLVGFGIFRTLRLSLILSLVMVLPFIDAAIALGHDASHWDADSPGDIKTAEEAIARLTLMKYAAYALIAALCAWAFTRAWTKAKALALLPVTS